MRKKSPSIQSVFDAVDGVAYVLLAAGLAVLVWGLTIAPPASLNDFVGSQYSGWAPGLVIDGVLLFVVNRIIRTNERKRVIAQVASLSNEFALDAVRRTRAEGWMEDGSLANQDFARARLTSADLSQADLSGTDLSFADLRDANLRHAKLSETNLVGANLGGADLRWANLTGARLMWADLRLAQLDGALLDDVDATFAAIDDDAEETGPFADAVTGGYVTERQIKLIRSSFELVLDAGESAVHHFYSKLFAAMPDVRQLFPEGMRRQSRKFLQSLRLIVNSLDQPEHAVLVLQQLGERHRGYGVRNEYYAPVGSVLIETLTELLGDAFTDEVKDAWIAVYTLAASVMAYASDAPGKLAHTR